MASLVLTDTSQLTSDSQHLVSSIHKTGCYQRLEGEEGYLDSPNYPAEYPQGLECCYEIARPSSRYCGLMLYAHLFQVLKTVEDGDFCLTDWFAMDSCVPEGGSRLCGNLTGSTFQYLFQPGSRAIRFIFHSSKLKCERTLEYRYQLKYHLLKDCDGLFQEAVHTDIPGETSTPCYTRIADRSGTINTPYHPSVYPNNVDCVYEFVRSNPFICGVRMRSNHFKLEPPIWTPLGGACSDYLQAPGCGFLCGEINFVCKISQLVAAEPMGTSLYQPAATSQKFHFHSDYVNSLSGFLIEYEQLYHC